MGSRSAWHNEEREVQDQADDEDDSYIRTSYGSITVTMAIAIVFYSDNDDDEEKE